ncbi:MAG: YebC/PmpR family DNA-binding transcriptional regulator [Leptospiraceae bacterium]|nr:YebC/PmpR family DNA-binding transcriptional regulator [Leptospiraceae bacterium]MDW8306611.1 YebC/PmpR family DNA-binding transcriptional regulator [Leptospiraceae bacterium]
MAGHSKWANIKHRKAAMDAKRGAIFTKLAKEISVAARLGGPNEHSNPRLRTAILKAKAANMPKENIERAIKKGAGELEGQNYEEVIYEGYGPGGIAIMVEVLTDKKSRTLPELRNLFTKAGGNMGEAGSVSYLFEYRGIIVLEGPVKEEDLLELVDKTEAEDLQEEEGYTILKVSKEKFSTALAEALKFAEARQLKIVESALKYLPISQMELQGESLQKAIKLIEALEDHDDVQNVFTNLHIPDAVVA